MFFPGYQAHSLSPSCTHKSLTQIFYQICIPQERREAVEVVPEKYFPNAGGLQDASSPDPLKEGMAHHQLKGVTNQGPWGGGETILLLEFS